MAWQMPFRSGWPSTARGARYACACPAAGVELRAKVAATAAVSTAAMTPRIAFRILINASKRIEYTGINSKVKEMRDPCSRPLSEVGRALRGRSLDLAAVGNDRQREWRGRPPPLGPTRVQGKRTAGRSTGV